MTKEHAACGVGFVAATDGEAQHALLGKAIGALCRVEHRGGVLADGATGDGAGIMAEVPFELLGVERGSVAVATLFLPQRSSRRRAALDCFEASLDHLGLEVGGYRDVPIDTSILGRQARESMPKIVHAFVKWPAFCRTAASFDQRLYLAKQSLRTRLRRAGINDEMYCVSLSTTTIVYKALTRADALAKFYPDLSDPRFVTRFALFHRRFSTNTSTSWDKAQPFRMIAHNGEINTIACNRAWSYSREQALGLPVDELLTHEHISDSGNLNEMVEALRYRSSIPHVSEILAIMVPPAATSPFYEFWSRAVEPWDGPAFLAYCDGEAVGARLDRNGFRPARWAQTKRALYLASEAGVFDLDESEIERKGALNGGSGAHVVLDTGEVFFRDPALSRENKHAHFDARLEPVGALPIEGEPTTDPALFAYTEEDRKLFLEPMFETGKEPIGSMGYTARPAVFSDQPRSFFDFFHQTFAQVTNPPLDHLREKIVTDLRIALGRRPNVFSAKELIPVTPGLLLESPILTLEQMAYVRRAAELSPNGRCFEAVELHTTFARVRGPEGLAEALDELRTKALAAIRGNCSILVLTDRLARPARPPIPSLLALAAVAQGLTEWGHRLDVSLVVDTGDARTSHDIAALIAFGAAAVCPYVPFELAGERKDNLLAAYRGGLLKIMSKMGISTVRGYQSSQLFTTLGLSQRLLDDFFPGQVSPIGGLDLDAVAERILAWTDEPKKKLHVFQWREHNKGERGERHSMTSAMSRAVHEVVEDEGDGFQRWDAYERYLALADHEHPVSPRHLLDFDRTSSIPLEDVQPLDEILRRLSAGSMSFGAISAESQRDIIRAMKIVGGRSGSGEGGENPYYWVDGTYASSKQVASGRFGVTAEYLIGAEEIEIKIAQGAKPGEGGQLMGVKVSADIARARHSNAGVDLISPPPLHDIYSIEDLRELIYELQQLATNARIAVKLVAGANIGAIAAGVVKAGADVVHISGGDGGTGAATLTSMKHAGLPWELGLAEAHRVLVEQQLREHCVLRVDGGLASGRDIVAAALLGAEQYSFGKLLLIAEGCIMARVCEKNTCPRGIATQDDKYKKKYRGTTEHVVTLLRYLAEDVRRHLASMGVSRIEEIIGEGSRWGIGERFADLARERGIDLSMLTASRPHRRGTRGRLLQEPTSRLNQRIVEDAADPSPKRYRIESSDRAVLTTLSGTIAKRRYEARIAKREVEREATLDRTFVGSAGQGFAAFLVDGIHATLIGEANDSVAKSMSGGRLVVRPADEAPFEPATNAIIGNAALYGATGGTLYVYGTAGDRFAVRNSGATAVVEGTGLHACEYMTNGVVVILGDVKPNVGAGMTGGTLYLRRHQIPQVNEAYLACHTIEDDAELRALLEDYAKATGSETAERAMTESLPEAFVVCRPR
ncbi:MAG: glutamate synthase large subunit [Deltaproteobacteria bacterium]